MTRILSISLVTVFAATLLQAQEDPALARAKAALRRTPVIDGHNDLPWQMRTRFQNQLEKIDLRKDQSQLEKPLHTDIPRLRQGMVGGQFWSVYVPTSVKGSDAVQAVLEQIDVVHRFAESYPDVFEVAYTASDIDAIQKRGKIASLIGMEGGHAIGNSLGVLRQLHRAGARYMTLTHSEKTAWADSATDAPASDGLSPFGEEVVREMNRLGMLVDLSHVSPAAMHDALRVSAAPVIFSHSSARAITDHPRDVPDDVLALVREKGGVVMVTFVPSFVSEKVRVWGAEQDAAEARFKALHAGDPERQKSELANWEKQNPRPVATIGDVADHIDHVRKVAGIDAVGIGGDLDGISSTPVGLSSVADYPALFAELVRRGYTEAELQKIAGLNILRVMRRVEETAARLQRERRSSDVVFTAEPAK